MLFYSKKQQEKFTVYMTSLYTQDDSLCIGFFKILDFFPVCLRI